MNYTTLSLAATAKPFVKWVGGKRQLLAEIAGTVSPLMRDGSVTTYVEPFVGGGAILFWMLENFPQLRRVIINDINADLTTAYMTVRDNVEKLISLLEELQFEFHSLHSHDSEQDYYYAKRERYNLKNLDAVENTALFIFLNRTCFNGLYRVNASGLFNVPFGRYAKPQICDEETLLADSELLQNVEIFTGDFSRMKIFASDDTLFYLDPPYKPLTATSSFNSYAKEDFGDSEQIRLKEFCDAIDTRGASWLLSNSDVRSNDPGNDFFDALYTDYNIQRVWASRSVNANPDKRGRLTEIMVSNIGFVRDVDQYEEVAL